MSPPSPFFFWMHTDLLEQISFLSLPSCRMGHLFIICHRISFLQLGLCYKINFCSVPCPRLILKSFMGCCYPLTRHMLLRFEAYFSAAEFCWQLDSNRRPLGPQRVEWSIYIVRYTARPPRTPTDLVVCVHLFLFKIHICCIITVGSQCHLILLCYVLNWNVLKWIVFRWKVCLAWQLPHLHISSVRSLNRMESNFLRFETKKLRGINTDEGKCTNFGNLPLPLSSSLSLSLLQKNYA